MNFTELEKYISADRLSTYSALLGVPDLDKAIGAYHWNKALGGAVYSFLQCLEVSLRNSMNMVANAKFNKETWYEPLCKTVGDDVRKKQAKAASKDAAKAKRLGQPVKPFKPSKTENEIKIANAINKLQKARKRVSAANVISNLTLGFWVNLFRNDYSSGNQSYLWPELLPKVFPNAPASILVQPCYNELKDINLMRNRFSHHEPLWKSGVVSNAGDAIVFLDDEMTKIVKYVRYINEDRAKMLEKSAAYKEFKGLNRLSTLDMFIGDTRKVMTAQQFKGDLNLHLKRVCDDHQMLFVRRGRDGVAKITCY